MTIFVLFSQQRSGAGALTSFIADHPTIENLTEILNPHGLDHSDSFIGYWLNNDPAQMLRSGQSPSELFERYLGEMQSKYVGMDILLDIKLNSIRHVLNYWEELPGFTEAGMPWVVNLFHRRGDPIIYLHRENHVERFISSKLAELTGVYRVHDPDSTPHGKITVDVGEMMSFVSKAEASHAAFMRYFERFERRLFLTYETLFAGSRLRPKPRESLARFVGLNPQSKSEPYYVKMGTARLERVVLNYDEVRTALQSHEKLELV